MKNNLIFTLLVILIIIVLYSEFHSNENITNIPEKSIVLTNESEYTVKADEEGYYDLNVPIKSCITKNNCYQKGYKYKNMPLRNTNYLQLFSGKILYIPAKVEERFLPTAKEFTLTNGEYEVNEKNRYEINANNDLTIQINGETKDYKANDFPIYINLKKGDIISLDANETNYLTGSMEKNITADFTKLEKE